MFQGLDKAFDGIAKFCIFSLFVLLPLSLWKLAEIVIWIHSHVSIGWTK